MNQTFADREIPMERALAVQTIYAITRLQPLAPFEGEYPDDDFAMRCADAKVQFMTPKGGWTDDIARAYIRRCPEPVEAFINRQGYPVASVTAAIFDETTPMMRCECLCLKGERDFRGTLHDRVGMAKPDSAQGQVTMPQVLSASGDARNLVLSADLWRGVSLKDDKIPVDEGPGRDIIPVRRVVTVEARGGPR